MQQNDYRTNWLHTSDVPVKKFPSYVIRNLTEVHPTDDEGQAFFQTLRFKTRGHICVVFDTSLQLTENERQFHLVYIKDTANAIYSLQRSSEIRLLSLLCDRCRTYPRLFSFTLSQGDPDVTLIQSIMEKLTIHPLWTDLHVDGKGSAKINSKDSAREFYLAAQQLDKDKLSLFNSVVNADNLVATFSKKDNTTDINFQDDCGNTLLHLAISCLNLEVVRLLLCLGADPNMPNNSGHSSLHIASQMNYNLAQLFDALVNPVRIEIVWEVVKSLRLAGAQRCGPNMIGCTRDCIGRASKVFEARPYEIVRRNPPTEAEQRQTQKNQEVTRHVRNTLGQLANSHKTSNFISSLSLDGGGVKGLVLLQLLIAIEEKLEDKLMNYFDWVAGTSTGSIVAAAMGRGKKVSDANLRHFRRMYLRPYNATTLEDFLKDVIGEGTTLADISYPKMFFTTIDANQAPPKLILQRTYNLPLPNANRDRHIERHGSTRLWKAIRRSTAAPTYFTPSEGFMDGGLAANNPSIDLITEILSWNNLSNSFRREDDQVTPGCLLSLGCGAPPSYKLGYNNVLRAISSTKTVIIEQVAATEGHPVDRAREMCHSHNIPFFRLNPHLSEDVDLAETRNTKLLQMMWDAFTYTKTHSYLLDEIVTLLKEIGQNQERRRQFIQLRR